LARHANTFIAAAGHNVGKSLYEADMLDIAEALIQQRSSTGAVPIPVDVVVAKEFSASARAEVKAVSKVASDDLILDIGPRTAASYAELLKGAGTIIWNGQVGVFEFDQFGEGTRVLAEAIAATLLVAGGGDTLAAPTSTESSKIRYNTGGGAASSLWKGKLPAVEVLEKRELALARAPIASVPGIAR
jgi:phosphoglycerate kinase